MIALLAATAATNEETASVMAALLPLGTASGPAGKPAARLVPVVGGAAHPLSPDRRPPRNTPWVRLGA
ncbi:hypothetical protein [Streptomyces sp. NPDC048411]|uniref:hypothetical protein n=1 Tax=Streptomyces sp. NPDC048411 TaxID=3157206 RepID=UPI00345474E8